MGMSMNAFFPNTEKRSSITGIHLWGSIMNVCWIFFSVLQSMPCCIVFHVCLKTFIPVYNQSFLVQIFLHVVKTNYSEYSFLIFFLSLVLYQHSCSNDIIHFFLLTTCPEMWIIFSRCWIFTCHKSTEKHEHTKAWQYKTFC